MINTYESLKESVKKVVTLFMFDSFGFPISMQGQLVSVDYNRNEQFNLEKIIVKIDPIIDDIKVIEIRERQKFIIWEGCVHPDTDQYKISVGSDMRQSYFCFDKRYMIDGLDSVEKEPIIKRF
ncbi:MAG: hypothetical protein N4A40_13005 [Tissierellales bacterium]|jgi:hypothetical protein|nr:hypothetical protein [Tissierellales bacterium]